MLDSISNEKLSHHLMKNFPPPKKITATWFTTANHADCACSASAGKSSLSSLWSLYPERRVHLLGNWSRVSAAWLKFEITCQESILKSTRPRAMRHISNFALMYKSWDKPVEKMPLSSSPDKLLSFKRTVTKKMTTSSDTSSDAVRSRTNKSLGGDEIGISSNKTLYSELQSELFC